MTKHEAEQHRHMMNALESLGFTFEECQSLRRISMTLRRWFELECGTGAGQVSVSIERDGDEDDSKPYRRIQYPTATGYADQRFPIADRETGARKRLAAIIEERNKRHYHPIMPEALSAYVQTDPRGAALYILRPGDVPNGADPSAYYSRGICVY